MQQCIQRWSVRVAVPDGIDLSFADQIISLLPRKEQIENRKEEPPCKRPVHSIREFVQPGYPQNHHWRGLAELPARPVFPIESRGLSCMHLSHPSKIL